VTPIARELLAPSLASFGRSVTLPAEAYAGWSVFRWEQEHFFDEGWVCMGRADGLDKTGHNLAALRVAEWHGWVFANASGDAPPFEEHVGNLDGTPKRPRFSPGALVLSREVRKPTQT
jgi:phenylpropionate dioxygenase-like ring-hydroxylating dioxygenase large terminal subunit